jgi:hypothetical protein
MRKRKRSSLASVPPETLTAEEAAELRRERSASMVMTASRRLTAAASKSGDRLGLIKAAALRSRMARTGDAMRPKLEAVKL